MKKIITLLLFVGAVLTVNAQKVNKLIKEKNVSRITFNTGFERSDFGKIVHKNLSGR